MALATMVNWTFNFLVSCLFLQMAQGIGQDGTFRLYACFGAGALVFFFFKVPETKNRSLEEIEGDIRGEPAEAQSS